MTTSLPFTVHPSPFTRLYPFAFIHDQWLMANGKCRENGKWLMVNGSEGALV